MTDIRIRRYWRIQDAPPVRLRSADEYAEAQQYGISRGLPKHQADFVSLLSD